MTDHTAEVVYCYTSSSWIDGATTLYKFKIFSNTNFLYQERETADGIGLPVGLVSLSTASD